MCNFGLSLCLGGFKGSQKGNHIFFGSPILAHTHTHAPSGFQRDPQQTFAFLRHPCLRFVQRPYIWVRQILEQHQNILLSWASGVGPSGSDLLFFPFRLGLVNWPKPPHLKEPNGFCSDNSGFESFQSRGASPRTHQPFWKRSGRAGVFHSLFEKMSYRPQDDTRVFSSRNGRTTLRMAAFCENCQGRIPRQSLASKCAVFCAGRD